MNKRSPGPADHLQHCELLKLIDVSIMDPCRSAVYSLQTNTTDLSLIMNLNEGAEAAK